MLLPVELIDRILSFLRRDHSALKACLESHPFLSMLAEQYLYADINITMTYFDVSSFYEDISKNPRILNHVRTMEITALGNIVVRAPPLTPAMLSIISELIPRMANLTSLKLRDTTSGNSQFNTEAFFTALEICFQQSSVEQLYLSHFLTLPLSVLDKSKKIKELKMLGCIPTSELASKTHYRALETLVLHPPNSNLLLGMSSRVANLRSLQLRGTMATRYDWIGFPVLLAACSKSLTELHLHIGDRIGDRYSTYAWDSTVGGHWIDDDLELPFTLSTHESLKHLFISSLVHSMAEFSIICSLPAITSLIKSAPAIQDVVLRLHWMDLDISTLGRLDWSLLAHSQPVGPRIHLHISIQSRKHLVSPDIILGALAENNALMSLVKREVVVLKPLEEYLDFF